MKKIIIKRTLLLLLFLFIITTMFYQAHADNYTAGIKIEETQDQTPDEVSNLVKQTGDTAIGIVRTVGYGVAIIILTVIGIKYMLASPGDRADIKKKAIPFVIGAVLLFASSTILGIISDLAKDSLPVIGILKPTILFGTRI